MKVKQIAEMLNTVFDEIIGESALVNEDLSNIVDVGRQITGSTQWGDNFENYTKKLIDKVGKTVFVDRSYKSSAPSILRDAWAYGSILEKVRCEVGDFTENKEWDLANYNPDEVFSFTPPSVAAKYYNSKSTFRQKISITRKQAESAFNSAQDMNRFVSMIENRVQMKMTIATDALIMRTIVNLMGEKIKANKNVINLLAEYKKASGNTTLTAATALTDREFLRFAAKEIMQYKKFLSVASALYNNDGYVTFTPAEKLKAVFLTDFSKALETTLYADTFNAEFVKLDGYSEVPFWQGTEKRDSINIKVASDGTEISKTGLLAVLFDEDAAAVCNEDPETTSIFNPEANFYNYWFSFDASYYNDLAENVVVFTIED